MGSDTPSNPSGSWERVASELRACRDSQKRAWGDVDDLTLGRYLAGEVSGDEKQHIEQALDHLPDLRLLTDLVRDVLEADLPAETSSPVTLPMQPRVPQRFPRWARRYASLLAAACLLLSLGIGLSQFAPSSSPGSGERSSTGTAGADFFHSRLDALAMARRPESDRLLAEAARLQEKGQLQESLNTVRKAEVALKLRSSDTDKAPAAMTLSPSLKSEAPSKAKVADAYARLGVAAQKKGDLVCAEDCLKQAYQINKDARGENAMATVHLRQGLNTVYQFALDDTIETASPEPWTANYSSTNDPSNPYTAVFRHKQTENDKLPANWHEQARNSGRVLRDRIAKATTKDKKAYVAPALIDAVKSARTSSDRARCLRNLGKLGPAAAEGLPILIEQLKKSDNIEETRAALEALGNMGPEAKAALPSMLLALGSERDEVARAAQAALVQLGDVARDGLAFLNDRDPKRDAKDMVGLDASARARVQTRGREVLRLIDQKPARDKK